MPTILYTFNTEEDRTAFMSLVSSCIHLAESLPKNQHEDLIKVVTSSILDPDIRGVNESNSRVFVSGMMVYEGLHKDAIARFESEVVTHSAKVELKSYKAGKWTTVRLRR